MIYSPSGGNVKEFFDLLDELCEAESFLAAHKNYLDADQALKQIVCFQSLNTCHSFHIIK